MVVVRRRRRDGEALSEKFNEIVHVHVHVFMFHRSKLGYIHHKDIEIVTMLNMSNTKTACITY